MKIIKQVCFSKFDNMRFVGHLDLLRMFQRAVNRSGLPVSYSQGFNPHQLVGFALPLPIGFTGRREYVDITLDEPMDDACVVGALSVAMPDGIEISGVREVCVSSASAVVSCSYEISLQVNFDFGIIITDMLSSEEIMIKRKGKAGEQIVNARPNIFELFQKNGVIHITAAAGSSKSLKPEYVIGVMLERAGISCEKTSVSYTRTGFQFSGENKAEQAE